MADQNLVKGDAPYPNYLRVDNIPIEGNATPVSFEKGELATMSSEGFLIKLGATKITGLYQVRNKVTGGLADDDSVLAKVNCIGTRILVSVPAGAHKGDYLLINAADGTNAVDIAVGGEDPLVLGIGRIFELYQVDRRVALANDLAVVDTGVI